MGDTAYTSLLKDVSQKFGAIDLAFIPIGCYRPWKYLEEKHIAGRRKYLRKTYFMAVHFATPERVSSGYIQNISSDGLFVETREPLSVGEQITLSFRLPHSEEHIKIGGEIARVSADGIGVKFGMNLSDRVKPLEQS